MKKFKGYSYNGGETHKPGGGEEGSKKSFCERGGKQKGGRNQALSKEGQAPLTRSTPLEGPG